MEPSRRYGSGAVVGVTKPGNCGHGYAVGACPMCDLQKPTVTPASSPTFGSIETHPAYAQIGASRCTGGVNLYGSDFTHHNFISVSIKRGELHRGLSRDWHSAREEYVEVWLSEAQWATFISSLNVGDGVPCTLSHRNGEVVSRLPRPKVRTAQFSGELADTLADAVATLAKLRERIASGKGGKESLALLDHAVMEMQGNATFVAKQFGEHMEATVERAKVEVNAYVQGTISRLGLEAARAPLALESDTAEEKE